MIHETSCLSVIKSTHAHTHAHTHAIDFFEPGEKIPSPVLNLQVLSLLILLQLVVIMPKVTLLVLPSF